MGHQEMLFLFTVALDKPLCDAKHPLPHDRVNNILIYMVAVVLVNVIKAITPV